MYKIYMYVIYSIHIFFLPRFSKLVGVMHTSSDKNSPHLSWGSAPISVDIAVQPKKATLAEYGGTVFKSRT